MVSARVFLAGPEVFLPDSIVIGRLKVELCARYGFQGVFPMDRELDLSTLPPAQLGLEIGSRNEALIRSCRFFIANLTPFRGPSADVGTAYELGFARALGLVTFGYTNVISDFKARIRESNGPLSVRKDGTEEDTTRMLVEPFGFQDNLMLVGAVHGNAFFAISAAEDGLFSDLAAFESCLSAAAEVRDRTA